MDPSSLLCFDSQLVIAAYQGKCASLLVRGNGQLALKAKHPQGDITHLSNTKRVQILTISVQAGSLISAPSRTVSPTTIRRSDGQPLNPANLEDPGFVGVEQPRNPCSMSKRSPQLSGRLERLRRARCRSQQVERM